MSKVITSPVKKWAGTVTLADPLTLPQAEAIESCLHEKTDGEGDIKFFTIDDKVHLAAVLLCVEKWELSDIPKNVTLETFPFTPRPASHQLIEWLWMELFKIYLGDAEVPNE